MKEEKEVTEELKRRVIADLSSKCNSSELVATKGDRDYTVIDMVDEIDGNTPLGRAYVANFYED